MEIDDENQSSLEEAKVRITIMMINGDSKIQSRLEEAKVKIMIKMING